MNCRFQSGCALLGVLVTLGAASVSAQWPAPQAPAPPSLPYSLDAFPPQAAAPVQTPTARLSADKTGFFVVRANEAQLLRLETDLGNVVIHTTAAGDVRYRVHVETDAAVRDAQKALDAYKLRATSAPGRFLLTGHIPDPNLRARLLLSYDVSVPRNFRIEVHTAAGNIQVDDTTGAVSLDTGGGNITVGRVSSAHLQTGGGHIVVGDVAGDLRAETAGGHITAANIGGDAVLITAGGHIHAGRIGGVAQLSTGGGNIAVDRADARVTASSAGGQIIFGEAGGAIQAHTAGGGIRVLRVAGPMQLDSNGGSILLTQVEKQVHATTETGSITAWFSPVGKLAAASQLQSGHGDIVVYVPRNFAMTIDATVDSPSDHRILFDQSWPMKISYVSTADGKQVHGECALNGGGEILHLRAASGNIQLRYADAAFNVQQQMLQQQMLLQMDLIERQLGELSKQTSEQVHLAMEQSLQELQHQQAQLARDLKANAPLNPAGGSMQGPFPPAVAPAAPSSPDAKPMLAPAPPAPPPGMPEVLWMRLDELWWGGIPVDFDEQQKRLVHDAQPVYPDVARQAGVEGTVRLRVVIGKDGGIQEIRPLSGQLVLLNAAIAAVKEWRYKPLILDGEAQPVVTTVIIEFRLQ